ncbi:MAG: hypothetical protein ABI946_05740 [Chthoniobacterales bacterium]
METNYRKFIALILLSFTAIALATPIHAAELTPGDKTYLANYEKVRAALAGYDLAESKKAAANLGEEGKALAAAEKIETARAEFEKLSDRAVAMAKGKDGYFVAYCPMVRKSWVQTSKEISNPYAGKEMLTCGVMRK